MGRADVMARPGIDPRVANFVEDAGRKLVDTGTKLSTVALAIPANSTDASCRPQVPLHAMDLLGGVVDIGDDADSTIPVAGYIHHQLH